MVTDGRTRREGGGHLHDLPGDEGIAVAVATDPGTHPQHRIVVEPGVGVRAAQRRTDTCVDLGYHLEEGGVVIPQAGADLVLDVESLETDQRRLPQGQDLPAEALEHLGLFGRRQFGPGAETHEFGDAVLSFEHGAAARLGRMGGDDRHHRRVRQCLAHLSIGQPGFGQLCVGCRQGAVLRRIARSHMDGAPAFAVDVLGEIGQQGEVAERTDHGHGNRQVDIGEHVGEGVAIDLRATDAECGDPRVLDQIEDLVARVFANHVTQQAAEQADVLTQWLGESAALVVDDDVVGDCHRGAPRRRSGGPSGLRRDRFAHEVSIPVFTRCVISGRVGARRPGGRYRAPWRARSARKRRPIPPH